MDELSDFYSSIPKSMMINITNMIFEAQAYLDYKDRGLEMIKDDPVFDAFLLGTVVCSASIDDKYYAN